MSSRTWFEPLPFVRSKADCAILNRAVRNVYPPSKWPPHSDLTNFLLAYKRGMSALDLINAVEDRKKL